MALQPAFSDELDAVELLESDRVSFLMFMWRTCAVMPYVPRNRSFEV